MYAETEGANNQRNTEQYCQSKLRSELIMLNSAAYARNGLLTYYLARR